MRIVNTDMIRIDSDFYSPTPPMVGEKVAIRVNGKDYSVATVTSVRVTELGDAERYACTARWEIK